MMGWNWPWARDAAGDAGTRVERKSGAGYGFVALHGQAEPMWTRGDYAALSREGFMRNPVVHRAVRMIAEAAANVPWLLYEGVAELVEHPMLELLARPNRSMGQAAFLETLYGHLLMSGNAYVELVEAGNAQELHLLRPDRVAVAADAAGWPVALEYRQGAAARRVTLGTDGRALHLRLFHPLDDHYGFPPLHAALMALDIHNATGRWNKALLDNSARPSGALVYAPKDGGNLTDDQYERLKSELEEGYSGAARAGRPMLLEGGLDWKAMGLTPKDMDFIDAKNAASRDPRYPRRQHLFQLSGSQPRLLSHDGSAAGHAHRDGAFGLAVATLRRRAAPRLRRRPDRGTGGGARGALGAGLWRGFPQ